MAEGHTEGGQRAEHVTVSQAAKILRAHRNTVHNYIQHGCLMAHKTMDGRREFYLIESDSLPNVQKGANEHPAMLTRTLDELVQRYGQELGAERVLRKQAEEKAARLEAELE